MRGDWRVASTFRGYLFPSSHISSERLLMQRPPILAGLQKCSIAATANLAVDETVVYSSWRIDPTTGQEDRAHNVAQQMNAYLGYPAVQKVVYDAKVNPNRIGIELVPYRTTNAERIELFVNARESQPLLPPTSTATTTTTTTAEEEAPVVWVCSEYVRQVTFGTGSTVGVPRQVVTNYAHFWTWRPVLHPPSTSSSNNNSVTTLQGNLLTCAYLDPLDNLYFEEPSAPVAVYSHDLTATLV